MNHEQRCSACGGTHFLRHSPWHGDQPICSPCMIIWYDPPMELDRTDPAAIGELSRRLKAARKWPWTGKYLVGGDTDATP